MIKEIIIVFATAMVSMAVMVSPGCDSDCEESKTPATVVEDATALPEDVTPTLAGDATPTKG